MNRWDLRPEGFMHQSIQRPIAVALGASGYEAMIHCVYDTMEGRLRYDSRRDLQRDVYADLRRRLEKGYK